MLTLVPACACTIHPASTEQARAKYKFKKLGKRDWRFFFGLAFLAFDAKVTSSFLGEQLLFQTTTQSNPNEAKGYSGSHTYE